ncbi:unnamed protein product [Rotaria sp. Silwood1]|nr:unnamed protein product [Rotaria sp. Silwood1]
MKIILRRTVEAQVFIDNPFDHPNDSFHVDIFADDNNYHVTITDDWLLVLIAIDRLIRARFPYRQAQVCTKTVAGWSIAVVAKVGICGTGSSQDVPIECEYTAQELDDCEHVIKQLADYSLSYGLVRMYGHCAGDPCSTYNDCDGSMICLNGKCGDVGSTVCNTPCTWIDHCCGDSCSTYDDCDGSLICVNGKCSSDSSSNGGGDGTCSPSGVLQGTHTLCNTENFSTCCKSNVNYTQYTCSPSSTSSAILTLNSFREGGDGGFGGACYGAFYPDTQRVVALSTGWFNRGSRCGKMITIHGNGKTTTAEVVDECDSVHGCDDEHAGQPPCRNNIVDGSPAVWQALGVSKNDPRYGQLSVSWNG